MPKTANFDNLFLRSLKDEKNKKYYVNCQTSSKQRNKWTPISRVLKYAISALEKQR